MANSLNKITTKSILDATVATADIADDAVTADKLANAINTDIAAKAVLTGSTNNTITTVTGANAIQGEASLTYNGTDTLSIDHSATNENTYIKIAADDNRRKTLVFDSGGTTRGVIGVGDSDEASATSLFLSANSNVAGDSAHLVIDSSGRVLIGTTTEGEVSSDDLTIATSGSTGITVRSGTSNNGTLAFSDGTSGADEYRGYIQYDHSTNRMYFGTNGVHEVSILDGGGISFNGDTAAANSLEDYEEGTWDPTFQTSDSNFSGGYSAQHGNYVKIGKLVYIFGRVSWSSTGGTGDLQIAGVPFAMEHGSDYDDQISIGYRTNIGYPRLHTSLSNSTDRINLHAVDGSSPFNSFNVVVGALQSTGNIYFAGCYRAD